MPTFRHGKDAAVYLDEKDLRPFLREFTISGSMDAAEITNFNSNGEREYIPGLRDAEVSLDGLFAAATASTADIVNFFDDALGGSTKVKLTLIPDGETAGNRAYLIVADPTAWDISSPVDDVVSCSVDLQASSGMDMGRLLTAPTTSTAAGALAAITAAGTTGAGGTTGGGVGHVHVWKERNVTTYTLRFDHSTTGSTWATLITFTAATGVSSQRSTVSGTIKERVRASVATLTEGATGGSISWIAAFARHGSPKK